MLVGSLHYISGKHMSLFQTLKLQNTQLSANEAINQLSLNFITLTKTKLASHGPYLKFSSIGSKHIPIEGFPGLIYWGFAPATSMVPKGTALQDRKSKSVPLLCSKRNTEALKKSHAPKYRTNTWELWRLWFQRRIKSYKVLQSKSSKQ